MPTRKKNHLSKANCLYVNKDIVNQTVQAIRAFGSHGCEGFVLWLGEIHPAKVVVRECLIPPQRSIKTRDGVGYVIEASTLLELNLFLRASGLRLVAQVHSHPAKAYHSSTDDKYAVVTKEGGFSLVIPYFGRGPVDITQWATYRLRDRTWRRLNSREVNNTIIVN